MDLDNGNSFFTRRFARGLLLVGFHRDETSAKWMKATIEWAIRELDSLLRRGPAGFIPPPDCLPQPVAQRRRRALGRQRARRAPRPRHDDRTHLGLEEATPAGRPVEWRPDGEANIVARARVAGLHHRYEWHAAA